MLLGHRHKYRFRWWCSLLTSAPLNGFGAGCESRTHDGAKALLLTRQVQSASYANPAKWCAGQASNLQGPFGPPGSRPGAYSSSATCAKASFPRKRESRKAAVKNKYGHCFETPPCAGMTPKVDWCRGRDSNSQDPDSESGMSAGLHHPGEVNGGDDPSRTGTETKLNEILSLARRPNSPRPLNVGL